MKKILIVDQDTDNLSILSEALIPYDIFRIITAENVRQAAELLEQSEFDLVITELYLPEINGLKLLVYLKKKFPKTHAIAMLKLSKPEIQPKLSALGVQYYFIKPLNVTYMVDAIFDELNIVPTGRIHGISLASFLQLVDIEKKTCTLKITCGADTGMVHCLDGEVIAAETGNLTGKKALYRIMFWKKALIEIEEECRKSDREIEIPLMYLLMESHQIEDENKDGKQQEAGKKITNEDNNPEKLLSEADAQKIKYYLADSDDVDEYGIFDENGKVQYTNNTSDSFLSINFSFYINTGLSVGDVLDISLNCIDIYTKSRARYILFKYQNIIIIAGLKPGCRSMDFMKRFKLQDKGKNE
ncbi:response regulator [Desulfobacterales bacterium HSG17]|nr:response regulator [Desulfobacterales bacterium HSG17]